MKIESFSSSQVKSLIIMFILGTSLLLSGDTNAMQDTWISILLSMAFFIPLVFIYRKLCQLYPKSDLFHILSMVYGKILGKLFIFLYTFYFFHLGAICIRNSTEYVQVVSFPETPQYITAIFIGALCLYAIHTGFSVLGNWAKMVLPLIIVMVLSTFFLAIPQFNYSYIKPILYNGWTPVISGGYSLLTFPFGETIIFLVFLDRLDNNKDIAKIYISGTLIGGFLLLTAALRNILLLGIPSLNNIYFPSHYATALINFYDFIQRIEIFISINLLLNSFIKIAICLYASYLGVINLFNIKKFNYVPLILCILMIILSGLLYSSTMDMFKFINIYKYYATPFQIIIPILTLIVALIKKGIQNH